MVLHPRKLCRCDGRHRKILLIAFIIGADFWLGTILLASVITNFENNLTILDRYRTQSKRSQTQGSGAKYYENSFRIDYTIVESTCIPIDWFNTNATRASIFHLTNAKLNMITTNSIFNMNIISVNPIIKNNYTIESNPFSRVRTSVCDYVLQLYIGFNFSPYCNDACQTKNIQLLTFTYKPFGDSLDHSFSIALYSPTSTTSTVVLNIYQFVIYQSSIYFHKQVYIRSFNESHYVSALILDPTALRTSIVISRIDRTLFLITNPLNERLVENNSSIIYISLLSTVVPNAYLRHENARIILRKNDESISFKQDATFKLLISKNNKNVVAFQALDLADSYIAIDSESKTALVLRQPKSKQLDIDHFDTRFLFELHFNK
ncbi:unnamed protein product [Rotaria magnacalcarata]|uniref:Alpha-L-arabinofuranosidase B arabinose-binding domain-containing protein n=1 Tax=Rotaria magnacalcarata TaxID=392030 RepID=A0A816MG44_9BILA|nr:unnamed protein product [Rotaria magnacalcarata]CAF1250245.1 unnamed protein product [Rotaria magnacalcarata]CAF1920932.1 unnamed protein product [Rotaria magnacalcarata]CAF1977785.1 unnamed protein product [Rotaria magnacalcarata]CAF2028099.1 unnamed protein product [Rotaria magnacalcarata]